MGDCLSAPASLALGGTAAPREPIILLPASTKERTIAPPKLFAATLFVLMAACSGSSEPPPDLVAAVAVVGYLASPRYIEISMYSATAETGTPSEFVSYLFSDMGASERSEPARPEESGGNGKRGGPPSWPAGIGFYALKPDFRGGRQVVVVPDDARRIIVAEGYVNPAGKPVLRREFAMARPRKPR